MTEPICKVADIIYVRFELTEFEEQKKYFDHFGLMLAYEDENSILATGLLYALNPHWVSEILCLVSSRRKNENPMVTNLLALVVP